MRPGQVEGCQFPLGYSNSNDLEESLEGAVNNPGAVSMQVSLSLRTWAQAEQVDEKNQRIDESNSIHTSFSKNDQLASIL
jgi:hypothetical protein